MSIIEELKHGMFEAVKKHMDNETIIEAQRKNREWQEFWRTQEITRRGLR